MKNTISKIFELPNHQLDLFPKEDMYVSIQTDGSWIQHSNRSVFDKIQQLSSGFIDLGIKKGDSIGIYAENSPAWNILDFAALQIGAVVVAIDPTLSVARLQTIISSTSIQYCFIENKEQLSNINSLSVSPPTTYSFNQMEGCLHWEVLFADFTKIKKQQLSSIQSTIAATDLATIVYTKRHEHGIKLSHKNLLSTLFSLNYLLTLDEEKNCLIWQSLNLISERLMAYLYVFNGCSIFYLNNTDNFIADIEKIKPHFFTGTPELLSNIYDELTEGHKLLKGLKKKGANLGMKIAQKWINGQKPTWDDIRLIVVKQVLFRKWRKTLGGNIEGILVDSSPLPETLNKVFNAAGIPIRQYFGLAEASGMITLDRFNEQDAHYGSVGRPIPSISLKLDKYTGEVLCKGTNVMLDYQDKSLSQTRIIDKNGWLHTGIKGYLKDGKFLFLGEKS